MTRTSRAWVWPCLLGLLLLGGWGAVFSGGFQGAVAWALIMRLLPYVGFIGVLIALYKVIRYRRAVSRAALAGGALSLIAWWPMLMPFGVFPMAYPSSPERTRPSATVRLPSDRPLRVAWGGRSLSGNYHAASPGQRWAYDLVIEPAGTGARALADYGCFDTPVVAPIDGIVHQAHDGEADLAIGATLTNPSGLLGNHVILKLEEGYLVIAHLKQGSVLAATGEKVIEGQTIGSCGNSGNTSEPHIHIHYQRQDPLAVYDDLSLGVNVVEGLPLYFRDHDGPAMPEGGVTLEGNRVTLHGAIVRHNGATDD